MGEIVNLNQARKARDKADRKRQAGINRVAHGRTKAEKSLARIETERAERTLDGSRRETGEPEVPGPPQRSP